MDSGIFIIAIIVIGVIIFASSYFSKSARIKRKIKNAPLKKISDVKDGETAKIIGSVEIVGQPLIAPLSGRKCSYYHIKVEQKVSGNKSSHWKTIIEEEVPGKFVLRDGKDCAFIDKNAIETYLVKDRKYSSGFLNDADDVLEKYLQNHGHKSENFFGLNKTLRYSEGVLEPGEKVAVLGTGKWINAEDLYLPTNYYKILKMKSSENEGLYLSDDPETTQ